MSRYTDEELAHLKSSVDLAALVRGKGIELKNHGSKDLIGHCPFHKDESPSFVVTPQKNLFHCLGCGAGGSVIDFMMEHDGLSFRHAVEILREDKIPKLLKQTEPKSQRATTPCLESPVEADANDHELMEKVISYYHERLQSDPIALNYLKKRGIDSPELIKHFGIGYADRTLGLRIPLKNRADGKQIRERLTALGLYRKSGHEHFNGCLVFPIKNEQGQTTEIYGRKVCQKQRTGIYHLYLPGPHIGIFNRECFQHSREIILCESVIDSLTFWTNGFKNTTCIYGTEGFSEELLEAFKQYKTQKVYLAYDRDEAGERATQRDVKKLSEIGIECYRIQFPHGMDANAYACKEASANQSLAALVRGAQWLKNGGACTAAFSTAALLAANDAEMAAKEKMSDDSSDEESSMQAESSVKVEASSIAPMPSLKVTCKGDNHFIEIGDREYRVRGLHQNRSLALLKINLKVKLGEIYHVDHLDLYQARHRDQYIERAAAELQVKPELIKRDLGKLLLKLEDLQQEHIDAQLSAQQADKEKPVVLSVNEREEALAFLKSKNLMETLLKNLERCGTVGEDNNKLTAWLASVSRLLERPLAVVIQSSSAAGKTTLMDAVLSFMPAEFQVKYSAMTGQSLYYLGETDLKHKILAIVEEEGAEKASYALKLLQSEAELSIASTGKDPNTGRMKTEEYRLEGPVMIFLTTTSVEVDEELLNRCLILSVDEGPEQTRRIHQAQRHARTLEGLIEKEERKDIRKLQHNVQRLLRSYKVMNPYANELTFPDELTRTRRDNEKYLNLIDTITLVHQYQRRKGKLHVNKRVSEYIEVDYEDIEWANRLAPPVLGRSLDELPPQTRKFWERIKSMGAEQIKKRRIDSDIFTFSRKTVREHTRMSHAQVKLHLDRLEELEYLIAARGRFGSRYEYAFLVDVMNKTEEGFEQIELLNVNKLKQKYGDKKQKLSDN